MLEFLFDLLMLYLLIMLVFNGVSMLFAYALARERFADPRFSCDGFDYYPSGAPMAFWREFWTISGLYLAYPLGFIDRDERNNFTTGDERPPVLFVHGWTENRLFWGRLLRRLLPESRRKLYTMNLRPLDASLSDYREQIDKRVQDILAASRHDRLVLVGHSMGGILIRDHIARKGAGHVEKAITLASPNKGTILGWLAIGQAVRDMLTHAPYLLDLDKDKNIDKTELHTIVSIHDNLVAAFDRGWMDRGTRHAVAGYGHTSMAGSAEVARILDELLNAEGASAPKEKQTPEKKQEKAAEPNSPDANAKAQTAGTKKAADAPAETAKKAKAKPKTTKRKASSDSTRSGASKATSAQGKSKASKSDAKKKAAAKEPDADGETSAARPESAEPAQADDELKNKVKSQLLNKLKER